ncbi:unnamed protein product [Dovyalis caffra]|uniref:Uncharacterized protein n=1 Tax=Dovyalis caffra TaxID=77055 RepID=A0AAV1S0K6_9ROSI|nr:unnamed protein product [Dovyalis caffra]
MALPVLYVTLTVHQFGPSIVVDGKAVQHEPLAGRGELPWSADMAREITTFGPQWLAGTANQNFRNWLKTWEISTSIVYVAPLKECHL